MRCIFTIGGDKYGLTLKNIKDPLIERNLWLTNFTKFQQPLKVFFCKKSNRDLLKRLLEESLEKSVVIESLGLPEVLKYNLSLRNKTLDVVVKANDKTILVEMNSNNYKGFNIRNFAFVCAKYI